MEKLTARLRVAVLSLSVLALIPIVFHLWSCLLESRGYLAGVQTDVNTYSIERAIQGLHR